MSAKARSTSFRHAISYMGAGIYVLTWFVEDQSTLSHVRQPVRRSRETGIEGARKFAQKWGVPFPGNVEHMPKAVGAGEATTDMTFTKRELSMLHDVFAGSFSHSDPDNIDEIELLNRLSKALRSLDNPKS